MSFVTGSAKGSDICVGDSSLRMSGDTLKPTLVPSEIVSHGAWSMDAEVYFGSMTIGVTVQMSAPPSGSMTLTFSSNTPGSPSLTLQQKFSDWS